jgi:hypothetical protein
MVVGVTVVTVGLGGATTAANAQETTLKAGVAVSSLTGSGVGYWDKRLITQSFGAHIRFDFGPIALQPELMATTRGAAASTAPELEQMRFEHFEVPVLIVLPFRSLPLEPHLYAGPSIILEARCRHVLRNEGLKTTLDCDPPVGEVFGRPALDFAAVVGAGVAHRIGSGRLSLEGRHTRGLRNIYHGPGTGEAHMRSWAILLGYSLRISND